MGLLARNHFVYFVDLSKTKQLGKLGLIVASLLFCLPLHVCGLVAPPFSMELGLL